MRKSGILCPISSLASKYGIGSFSQEAYDFVDFLVESGQSYWQVLPFGPTGFGDSPYQSFSTFAGNPYFISPDLLIKDGLLSVHEVREYDFGSFVDTVDYGALYNNRFKMLQKACDRFLENPDPEYEDFKKENAYWLDDYCLYMAIKLANGGKPWSEWDEELRTRYPEALVEATAEHLDVIEFFSFQQYEFQKQWKKLHSYANEKGVEIIGDIPFYTAVDSADSWANPKMFLLDEENMPTKVAGCPPDAFSADGQLWGNPIYDWKYLKKTNYEWWIRRIRRSLEFCDVLRVDHFRAFDEYYEIPYGEKTAKNGKWVKGPGMGLFRQVKKELGDIHIIAEDLGYITPSVRKLVKDTGRAIISRTIMIITVSSIRERMIMRRPGDGSRISTIMTGILPAAISILSTRITALSRGISSALRRPARRIPVLFLSRIIWSRAMKRGSTILPRSERTGSGVSVRMSCLTSLQRAFTR